MISLNILFANDDVLTQWVMADVLAEAGFTVVGAGERRFSNCWTALPILTCC